MRRYITTGAAVPATNASISHAVVVGPICYVSGQLPVDLSGKLQVGDMYSQGKLAFDNLFAVVEAAGLLREDIVYIDIALLDLGDLDTVNGLFAELFPINRPARTVYQAAALPFGSNIKVQAIAIRDVFA